MLAELIINKYDLSVEDVKAVFYEIKLLCFQVADCVSIQNWESSSFAYFCWQGLQRDQKNAYVTQKNMHVRQNDAKRKSLSICGIQALNELTQG